MKYELTEENIHTLEKVLAIAEERFGKAVVKAYADIVNKLKPTKETLYVFEIGGDEINLLNELGRKAKEGDETLTAKMGTEFNELFSALRKPTTEKA